MRILFLHPNFPAQFRHVSKALAQNPKHTVVFGTNRQEGNIPGVKKAIYQPSRPPSHKTHHYVIPLEKAVLEGQAVYRLLTKLKQQQFIPDIVFGHSGWGPTLFIKDIFPQAQLLCYFEWFYHAHGSDADFDPDDPIDANTEARIRIKNAPILIDLYSCDRGLSPTKWQKSQFPLEFHSKITVRHDGVDTEYFRPLAEAKLNLPRINLNLSTADEILTYVARGMEPYRGFPQLMETLFLLQQRRPKLHAVIVGQNRVAYGKQLPQGQNYKDLMLQKFPLDMNRVHFTGLLPYHEYLQVLQASSVHLYLTRPFVLSWSMLEALSTGCVVVGSKTAPVMEVIEDEVNGLLVDFFDTEAIAARIEYALENQAKMTKIRKNARETCKETYDLAKLIPQHLSWLLNQE